MLLVQGDHDLTITVALEYVSCLADQVSSDSVGIVQLSIDDGMDGALLAMERLCTVGAEVDYGKADMAEG
jgi:hypothetical protein